MQALLKPRLAAMMFLEFFIWGGWFVTMGTYLATTLGASGVEIGSAYSTQSWGAIVAPFAFGLVADRWVSAERLLGAMHLAGAALLFLLSRAGAFGDFHPLLLAYMLLYELPAGQCIGERVEIIPPGSGEAEVEGPSYPLRYRVVSDGTRPSELLIAARGA